jgi:hypothetical protein
MYGWNFDWSVKFFTHNIIIIYLVDLYFINLLEILDWWCRLKVAVITMVACYIKFYFWKICLIQKYWFFFRLYILFFFAVYFQGEVIKHIFLLLEVKRKIFLDFFVVNLGYHLYYLHFVVLCFVEVVMLVYYVNYKTIWLSIRTHCYSI